MQTAIMYDETANTASKIDAASLHARVRENAAYLDGKRFFSPVRGVPVVPKFPRRAIGNEIKLRAHFACAAGYGLKGHVLDRNGATDHLGKTLDSGKTILLSINADMTFADKNYRFARGGKEAPLEQWIEHHYNNYLSVSVSSAKDVIRVLNQIHRHDKTAIKNGRVCALYQGGVLGYQDFYLGRSLPKLKALYNSMAAGQEGLNIGQSRVLGFPRLFHFDVSQTTLKENGVRGLKGNHLRPAERGDSILFSKLIPADPADQDTPAYSALWNHLSARNHAHADQNGVYVMAAPSITINPDTANDRKNWSMLRWVIYDIDRQTSIPGEATGRAKPASMSSTSSTSDDTAVSCSTSPASTTPASQKNKPHPS